MTPFPPSRRQRRAFAVLAAIATLLAIAAAAPPHPTLLTPAHAQSPTPANQPYLPPVDRWPWTATGRTTAWGAPWRWRTSAIRHRRG